MKKFTWIFGLALLWGGLNVVAQTTKEVGTFADLKKAVENIPQFEALKGLKEAYIAAKSASETAAEEVTTATTAYQTAVSKTTEAKEAYEKDPNHAEAISAEEEYKAAVTSSNNAEKEYNDKLAEIERLKGELPGLQAKAAEYEDAYNAAESAVENFEGVKTESKPHTTTSTKSGPVPYYTDFYNAISDEYDYNNGTSNNNELTYGVIKGTSFSIIVFAPNEIDVQNLLSTTENKNYTEYEKPLTVYTLNEWGEHEGVTFDGELSSFVVSGVTKVRIRFYYKDDATGNWKNVQTKQTATLENPLQALMEGYESLEIDITTTETTYEDEDTEAYAAAKKDRDDALATWNTAKEKVTAKEKEVAAAEEAADKLLSKLGALATVVQNKYNLWQTALNAEKPTREKWEAAQRAEEEALAAKTAAETTKEKADTAVETAKTNYNNAAKSLLGNDEVVYDDENLIICEAYTTIAIKANLTGVSTITKWPANYVLDGEGHFVETTGALFELNEGTIKNLATPNGHIAEDNKGKVSLCLTKWDKQYRVYTLSGNYESHNTAEDAIYSMREVGEFKFGYNVETGQVVPIASDTKLYQGTYANAENSEPISFKLNISNNSLKINQSILGEMVTDGRPLKENAIVYIENNDAIGTGIENVENIAIKGATATSSYTCYNTVLTDDDNAREFYIPGNSDEKKNYNFSSKRVTYARNFNQKYAAVCFPFTLTKTQQTALGIEAAYQFKEVNTETGIMWFSLLEEAPANEPCLIVFKDSEFEGNSTPGSIFANYKETASFQFKETPNKLVALDTNDKETFYGTYKLNTVRGLLGKNSTDAIYGIVKGELVKMTGDNTKFKAFRSYVRTVNIPTTSGAPSYKIGLMDEDGNELSTAIETVTGEIVSGFKAKGGDNVIEIVTNEACPVKVYALNGALVKSTRVEAGATSLPVKAGIYVVNGTKVIVK